MLSRYLIGLTQQANHLLDVKTFMSRCVLRKTAHVLTYVFALVSGKTREKVRERVREKIFAHLFSLIQHGKATG